LSSINIYSEVARQRISGEDRADIITILTRITESSADVMENMQNIVWAVNPKNDELETILVHMQVFATEVLEPKNIRVSFRNGIQESHIRMDMGQRRDLFLIFKEAINNIAKYSRAANVSILFRREGKQFLMQIEDDGIGFDTGRKYAGNGLKNMTARVRQIGGELSIVSQEGKGALIVVTLRI
jgi:signal transduction histidine kinase